MVKRNKNFNHPVLFVIALWYSSAWSWTLSTDILSLAGSKKIGIIIAIIVSIINITLSVLIIWNVFKISKALFFRYKPYLSLLLVFSLFVLADFLVSWLTAIIWIGPEGQFDSILPLSSPSLFLINTPFGYAARIVGFYGLAGFSWLIFFLVISKKRRLYSLYPIMMLSILAIVGWSAYKTPDGTELTITIISEEVHKHIPVIEPQKAKLVLFPEYGLDGIQKKGISSRIVKNDNRTDKKYFVGSQSVPQESRVGDMNTLLFGNTTDGITSEQDKYRLIPGGEDLSYIGRIGLRATNQTSTLDFFSATQAVVKGKQPLKPFTLDDNTIIGAAVCSSIVAPQDYQHLAQQGATVFTNSASLSIFKGSGVFTWQQKSLARFIAIANSRYFLQSANSASAYALDNNGKNLVEISGQKAIDKKVINNSRKTLYTFMGEWVVVVGFATSIWLFYDIKLNRLKSRRKLK